MKDKKKNLEVKSIYAVFCEKHLDSCHLTYESASKKCLELLFDVNLLDSGIARTVKVMEFYPNF